MMDITAQSFLSAATEIADWVEEIAQVRPVLMAPGFSADTAGIGITPWRMLAAMGVAPDRPAKPTAFGEFVLSIGPEAPDYGCPWYDALYFAALSEPGLMVRDDTPPPSFWRTSPGLALTIARRIERMAEQHLGQVLHPLIFDVTTDPQNPQKSGANRGT